MISFTDPIALLLLIPLAVVTVWAWGNGYSNLSRQRLRLSLAIRLVLLAAIVLGLAGAALRLAQNRQSVVFVSDLSASDYGQRSSMQTLINSAAAQRPGSDTMGIVAVGQQPVVEQPVSGLTSFDGFQSTVDLDYTNLQGGLELANALLPAGYQHRVVVVSDGQQNVGDGLSEARLLHSEGVRVDVSPVRVPAGPEVLVDRVDVPAELRAHESFALTVLVHSTVNTTTGLTILRDQSVILSRKEPVHRGENRYVFSESSLPPGFHTYRVEISPATDTQPQNNRGSAFTSVAGPPKVLVIAEHLQDAAAVVASLKSTGIQTDLRRPIQVTPELGYLQHYAAVVIVNTSADVLGPDLMTQLVPYVRDLGHGLVVLGGEESYGLGGYGQTPLERALPVEMNLPKRRKLPTVAVVLIIESLEENTQINISKEAGKGMVDLLTPRDQVAVNDTPYDGSAGWVVPLQHVTNKAAIDAAIERMEPGDPDTYAPTLQSAYNILKHTQAKVKHIILLGDGDAEDPAYQQLVQGIRAGGVTVSTVSTNGMGRNDFQTMQDIARWGGGRYYRADDPTKIPQIFLREARTVARSGIVTGKFYPQELSANPMMRDVRKVAPLYGYIATTPKPAAEVVLASKKLDPVLAAWQLGLGRSVAWTSDAAGLWTKDWLRAPGANHFWANLVSWVLPASGSGHLFIAASSSGGDGHISVNIPSNVGASPNVIARVLDPSLHTTSVQLQPTAPNQFSGAFQAKSQGAYFVTVEASGTGHADAGQVGMDIPYSAEYRTTGLNMTFLRSLAAAGGGSVITRAGDAWRTNLSSAFAQHSLTTWLWLLALLLLPVDIGVRRLILTRRELAAILAALPFHKTPVRTSEPSVGPLSAIRNRREQRSAAAFQWPQDERVEMGLHRNARSQGSVGMSPRPVPRTNAPQTARPPRSTSSTPDMEESTASKLLAAKRGKR